MCILRSASGLDVACCVPFDRVMKRLVALIVCAVVLCAGSARGTDLRNVITDITITSWNEKDGLPSATIMALAQGRDGYLWVGSRQGLFRFDGVRFLSWDQLGVGALPGTWVRALLTTGTGDLWVGFGGGQMARLREGQLSVFGSGDGLNGGDVLALASDTDGRVWAGTAKGLLTFDGTRWTRVDSVPASPVVGLFMDRDGVLYAATDHGLYARRKGDARFERIGDYGDAYGSLAQTRDGAVWVTDPRGGHRLLSGHTDDAPDGWQGRGLRMLVDRKGNLWTGTGGQGLWRTKLRTDSGPVSERTTSQTGLLGDGVYALLEDRDGNIWAGTTEGLNRITPRTIQQIVDIGLVRAIDTDRDGRVWVGTADRLFVYPAGADERPVDIPLHSDTRVVAADAGGVWVAAAVGVFKVERDGRRTAIAGEAPADIDGLVPDGAGGVWLLSAREGPVHWDGHRLARQQVPEAVRGSPVTAAFVDSGGRAWFAFANGRLATMTGVAWTTHPVILPAGHVARAFAEDAKRRLWLGGDGVLARLDGAQADVLLASERFAVSAVTAIVPDNRGSIWLGAPSGVIHMSEDAFEQAARDPRRAARFLVYSRYDGVAGTPVAVPTNRGAVRTSDGRVWFVTTRGITVLDPHVLEARNAPVPIRLEGVLADGHRLAHGASLSLPAGTRTVEIDYTVVNLTSPLKTRFRYRLEPFDADWVDAGTRRQAFFTNLKPGQYVFHVSASAGAADTGAETAWPLVMAPRFYQTWAFAGLIGVSIVLAVLGGWHVRERHLRDQFSLLIAERARLGREIHDTLLQGLVAIALQFDSLAHELAPLPVLQARFHRLRDRVEEYIRDARRSIWDLHTQPAHRNLLESLRQAGEFATDGREIAFSVEVQGTPYECPPLVEEQVIRIAQEASLNSVRHASPRVIRIALCYDDAALTLVVADDGRGFDAGGAREAGHYGLTSMQERARSVGGALTLVTAPGRGTEVTAVLPVAS